MADPAPVPSLESNARRVEDSTSSAQIVEDASLTNGVTNHTTERCIKKFSSEAANFVVHLLAEVFAWICFVLPWVRRNFQDKQTDSRTQNSLNPTSENSRTQEQHTSQEVKEDSLHPCWQRLQELEASVNELVKKPSKIPPEKEDMLIESLTRIKSIEHDLQKTKRALIATASKQVELAESLENLREASSVGNNCWPRNRRPFPPEREWT